MLLYCSKNVAPSEILNGTPKRSVIAGVCIFRLPSLQLSRYCRSKANLKRCSCFRNNDDNTSSAVIGNLYAVQAACLPCQTRAYDPDPVTTPFLSHGTGIVHAELKEVFREH